jgi:hypothetical protein
MLEQKAAAACLSVEAIQAPLADAVEPLKQRFLSPLQARRLDVNQPNVWHWQQNHGQPRLLPFTNLSSTPF